MVVGRPARARPALLGDGHFLAALHAGEIGGADDGLQQLAVGDGARELGEVVVCPAGLLVGADLLAHGAVRDAQQAAPARAGAACLGLPVLGPPRENLLLLEAPRARHSRSGCVVDGAAAEAAVDRVVEAVLIPGAGGFGLAPRLAGRGVVGGRRARAGERGALAVEAAAGAERHKRFGEARRATHARHRVDGAAVGGGACAARGVVGGALRIERARFPALRRLLGPLAAAHDRAAAVAGPFRQRGRRDLGHARRPAGGRAPGRGGHVLLEELAGKPGAVGMRVCVAALVPQARGLARGPAVRRAVVARARDAGVVAARPAAALLEHGRESERGRGRAAQQRLRACSRCGRGERHA